MRNDIAVTLPVLANRHGTDKAWSHHYIPMYALHFERYQSLPIRLLEIGIGGYNKPKRGGASLKMWADYFWDGEVIGIDIEDKSFLDSGSIRTYIVDQTDEDALNSLNWNRGPFDIVIDDGSHRQDHVLKSFQILFPLLNHDGLYVIEDLECCYKPCYGGSPDLSAPNAISLIQRFVDSIQWKNWGPRERGPTDLDRMVRAVHVYKEICFIEKR